MLGSFLVMTLASGLKTEQMPSALCQDHPLSFFDWATLPLRTDSRAKGVAEKAKPVASLPTTRQEDQGGARPTLNRGGRTQRNKTATSPTKVQLEPAKRNSPPPLLYIPSSPRPNYETFNAANFGHYNTLTFHNHHSPSSHNSRPPASLYQQLENFDQGGMDTQHHMEF